MSKLGIGILVVLAGVVTVARHVLSDASNVKSIAVLPFIDVSPSLGQDYFTDGVTEEVMDRLSRGGLQVAARESSFAFKGQREEMSEIARRLKVDAVLEGTIHRDGDSVRATVKLFDATKRSVTWSESFHLSGTSAFALQDEISASIVKPVNALLVR